MPNFAGTQHGVFTRIATRAYKGALHCFGVQAAGMHIDALAIHYDQIA
jgi:hypothetical protein